MREDVENRRAALALEEIARGLQGNPEVAEALRQRAFRLRYLEEFNQIFGARRGS